MTDRAASGGEAQLGSASSTPVRIRSKGVRLWPLIDVVLWMVPVLIAIAAFNSTVALTVVGVAVVHVVAVCLRLRSVVLEADEHGVRIANIRRPRRVAWSDVERLTDSTQWWFLIISAATVSMVAAEERRKWLAIPAIATIGTGVNAPQTHCLVKLAREHAVPVGAP